MSNRRDYFYRCIWWVTGNFLWSLFISLFEPILMSVLLTRILLLYPFVGPMFKFKSLGSMCTPKTTEKSTSDNVCSNTP